MATLFILTSIFQRYRFFIRWKAFVERTQKISFCTQLSQKVGYLYSKIGRPGILAHSSSLLLSLYIFHSCFDFRQNWQLLCQQMRAGLHTNTVLYTSLLSFPIDIRAWLSNFAPSAIVTQSVPFGAIS